MKQHIRFPALIALLALSFLISLPGYCTPDNDTYVQLKAGLKSEGVSDDFLKITENSVRVMLASAAPTVEVKDVLMDLWREGVKGRALKNAIAAVAELVKNGDDTLVAAKIASTAAHEAEAKGLSGFGVGMRVKKAVEDRKAYLKTLEK
jgi:hypothetical protein